MLSKQIKEQAKSLGFDLVGITSANPHDHRLFFNNWINKGYQGNMEWLMKGQEKRNDPQKILPGAKTIICCGLNYYRGKSFSIHSQKKGHGWISNYAWGNDYHQIVLEKLKQLEIFILDQIPNAQLKSYVDTGPVLERSYANSAGLGWIGKNTCLINKKIGSFFFLGEILTNLELEVDQPELDHCGKCTRCIDACSTDAISAYELNAKQCISYLTIEHRDSINPHLAQKMGNHLVGCDICQDVCPWNQDISQSNESSFDPLPENFYPSLQQIQKLNEEQFSKRFKNSPIKRVKLKGLQRNVEIAIKNEGS